MEEIGTKDRGHWLEKGSFPELPSEMVHVWRVPLTREKDPVDTSVLSAAEVRRADAFHFARDRVSYSVTRSSLRILLGRYLKADPREIRIDLHPDGKPYLRGESGLRFNVSHSHEVALLAFARQVEVGVDVEFRREEVAVEELAERFFAAEERRAVIEASGEEKRKQFYDIWSAKEACVKASGAGLQVPLEAFSVITALVGNGGVVELPLRGEREGFRLYPVPQVDGYAAALAVGARQKMATRFFGSI